MRSATRLAFIALGCLLVGGTAGADMLSDLLPAGVPGYGTAPGVTVGSRLRPDYQPRGIRTGAFLLHPVLEEALGYDTAPFGASTGGSWLLATRPSLLVGSDWSRHALGAYVAVDDSRYLDAPAQSRTDWTLSAGGALDVGRDRLTLSAAHLSQHQDRTQIGALATDRPVAFRLDNARASYAASAGRWTATPEAQISAWHFSDATLGGAPFAQGWRDRTSIEVGATLDYELAPRRDLLLRGRAVGQHYLQAQPNQPTRDSTSYQMLFGYADDDGGVWRYRLLLGVESRQFATPVYRTHTAAVGEGDLAWNPTGLTTVTATLTRSIEDAAQEGAAGFTYTAAKLRIDHEYRRNLLLNLSAAVAHAEFLQGGGQQTGWALGAGVTWLVNRSLHVTASYDLSQQNGGATGGYTRQLALLTLRVGM